MRSLDTTRTRIEKVNSRYGPDGRTLRGLLAEKYDGTGSKVKVRIGDTDRALIVTALITNNTELPSSVPAGMPVTLRSRRGRFEVIGAGIVSTEAVECILEKTTTQSISSAIGTLELVTWVTGNVLNDTHSCFDNTNDTIIVPFDGTYLVTWYILFANDATGQRRVVLRLNGSNKRSFLGSPIVSQPWGYSGAMLRTLSADDTLSLHVSHNQGAALNITEASLAMKKL